MKTLNTVVLTVATLTLVGVMVGLCIYIIEKQVQPVASVKSQATHKTQNVQLAEATTSASFSKGNQTTSKKGTLSSQDLAQTTTVTPGSWFNLRQSTLSAFIVTEDANVRRSPGTGKVHPIVKVIKEDSIINVTEQTTLNGVIWYRILTDPAEKKKEEWVSSKTLHPYDPTKSVLIDTPVINQLPELERGCEVTSLAMLLEQAGIKVNKMTLAKQIKTLPFTNGTYRSNPNDGFVGDIYTFDNPGLGVYHEPIANLAKTYLGKRVDDLTGQGWNEVIKKLNEGHAVWVITNSTLKPLPDDDSYWYTWKTKEGTIRVTYKEHSVLVTGYDPSKNLVFVNDPLSKQKNIPIDQTDFIAAWIQLGSQAISY